MSHDESLALAKLSTPFPLSTGCSVCLSMCESVTGKMGFSFKALDLCVCVCVCVFPTVWSIHRQQWIMPGRRPTAILNHVIRPEDQQKRSLSCKQCQDWNQWCMCVSPFMCVCVSSYVCLSVKLPQHRKESTRLNVSWDAGRARRQTRPCLAAQPNSAVRKSSFKRIHGHANKQTNKQTQSVRTH